VPSFFFLKNETLNVFHWNEEMNREVKLFTTRPISNGLIALNTDVIILAFTRLSTAELPV